MLKDITLGQYFPGNSPIHRLDPRSKLLLLVVYITALFLAKGWVSYGVILVFLITVIRISTIPPKAILRGMKPLVMIHRPVFGKGLGFLWCNSGVFDYRHPHFHHPAEGYSAGHEAAGDDSDFYGPFEPVLHQGRAGDF